METLTQMMSRYTSVAKSIRTKLMTVIDASPENPNIKGLDICCFIVSSTEVLESRMLCAAKADFEGDSSNEGNLRISAQTPSGYCRYR